MASSGNLLFALLLGTRSTQLLTVYVCRYLVTKRLVVVRLSTTVNNRKKNSNKNQCLVLLIMFNDNPVIKKATVTEYHSNDYQQISSQNRAIVNASANYCGRLTQRSSYSH